MDHGPLSSSAEVAARTSASPPGPVDLRPLTTSELIDRGFTLYRAHFAGFLLLALLCQAAPLLGQILTTGMKLSPTQAELMENPLSSFGRLGAVLGIMLAAQLFVFFFEVVIAHYIADAYLGKIPSVKESLRKFTHSIGASLWTCILSRALILLTLLFPVIAGAAVFFYISKYPPTTLGPLIGVGSAAFFLFIASMAPVLIVFMRLMITVPALALEGLSGWKAIKRSSSLVRYDPGLGVLYWGEMRLSFLLLPLFIIELMILTLTSLPLTIHQIGELLRNGTSGQIAPTPDSVMILSQVLTFLAGSLILPLYSIATTLFYYDIRIRREGFDLEFLSRHLGERP